ncbi:hypothetical protein AAMO2058_000250900 [Amorphochlora amoebiformis]
MRYLRGPASGDPANASPTGADVKKSQICRTRRGCFEALELDQPCVLARSKSRSRNNLPVTGDQDPDEDENDPDHHSDSESLATRRGFKYLPAQRSHPSALKQHSHVTEASVKTHSSPGTQLRAYGPSPHFRRSNIELTSPNSMQGASYSAASRNASVCRIAGATDSSLEPRRSRRRFGPMFEREVEEAEIEHDEFTVETLSQPVSAAQSTDSKTAPRPKKHGFSVFDDPGNWVDEQTVFAWNITVFNAITKEKEELSVYNNDTVKQVKQAFVESTGCSPDIRLFHLMGLKCNELQNEYELRRCVKNHSNIIAFAGDLGRLLKGTTIRAGKNGIEFQNTSPTAIRHENLSPVNHVRNPPHTASTSHTVSTSYLPSALPPRETSVGAAVTTASSGSVPRLA